MYEEEETSLTLLQSIYRDPELPLSVRMRAAGMAIAYERPKLSVSASVNFRGLGDAIDAARQRHVRDWAPQSARVIEHERQRG